MYQYHVMGLCRITNKLLYLIMYKNSIIYKKVLPCYNLFWLLLELLSLSDTCFIRQTTRFITRYLCVVFHCYGNIRFRVLVVCLYHVWFPLDRSIWLASYFLLSLWWLFLFCVISNQHLTGSLIVTGFKIESFFLLLLIIFRDLLYLNNVHYKVFPS